MKMSIDKLKILILLGLALTTSNSFCQNNGDISSKLKEYVNLQHQQMGFNGLIIVSKNDKIISKETIGYASYELYVPITLESKFRIASITKQFTAQLIVLAEAEGKLKFDSKLLNYFPMLRKEWNEMTIHHLLSHTSGLPHWEGIADYWKVKSKLDYTDEEILEEIFQMDLLFEPGSDAKYSSLAYFLLAEILEKIYDDNYTGILKTKILQPLNMNETGQYDNFNIISGLASGYHLLFDDSLIAAPFRNHSFMKGGGNLYSSAGDLLKWNNSFLSDSVWNTSIKNTLFTSRSEKQINSREDSNYGYGWYIRNKTYEMPEVCYHGGGSFGCSAFSSIYPEDKISIVILTNVSFLPMDQIWNDVEKIVFGKPFKMPEILNTFSPDKLEKFAGTYLSSTDKTRLDILLFEKKLFAKLGVNPHFEIHPSGANKFIGKKVDIEFTFEAEDSGKIKGLKTSGRGKIFYFNKQ